MNQHGNNETHSHIWDAFVAVAIAVVALAVWVCLTALAFIVQDKPFVAITAGLGGTVAVGFAVWFAWAGIASWLAAHRIRKQVKP